MVVDKVIGNGIPDAMTDAPPSHFPIIHQSENQYGLPGHLADAPGPESGH
jgi:hypothetical protein